ncbi:MAG TPA: class I SAM-dependent methyltransferase [Vicinamibacteria bacterium]|nr:class I SAM-dependent methyltransferase [Vicinamibacteria bacterium]
MNYDDLETANAFAESWNRLPAGSAYTRAQFEEWMAPLDLESVRGKNVLELGFGNGSLLYHMARCGPALLSGVELGDTLETARRNVAEIPGTRIELHRGDLTRVELGTFDLVYCIGVLHHLKEPGAGFEAVLRHTRPGGRFHCWVYAREGNAIVRTFVDPVRRVSSRLPWWLTKYGLALPLAAPYFAYAKSVRRLAPAALRPVLPLYDYSLWIAEREFRFFHHVAFDQLVTPTTAYIPRSLVERWLSDPRIEPGSSYVVFRNGNSWKFGGVKRLSA